MNSRTEGAPGHGRSMVVALLMGVFLVLSVTAIAGQDGPAPLVIGEQLEVVQRHNFTLRTDGRYEGHVQRESRLWLTRGDGGTYRGEYLESENTLRDMRTIATRVDERRPVEMRFDGERIVADRRSRQELSAATQGLPTIPRSANESERGPGDRWEAPAMVRVQFPDGAVAEVPTVVTYRFLGSEAYQGDAVDRIDYGYAVRWPLNEVELEEHAAADLIEEMLLPRSEDHIRGNHQGTILLPRAGGVPLLHRTEIQQELTVAGEPPQERSGFVLTWYQSTRPEAGLLDRIAEIDTEDVDVDRDEHQRVRLSIRNLRFVADQAELLPGEVDRLDAVAEVLSSVSDGVFLITGHTADVGSAESQQVLSEERARRIADGLIARGIPPGALRYEGRGGTEPVGDNGTDAGRAANRRVEIRILSEGRQ
ncbi:MAG: OmpA family protein [Alkalispirochaeta sp.]